MGVSWMDVIVGASKFLVSMFWSRSSVPSEFFFPIACDVWTVLCLYWSRLVLGENWSAAVSIRKNHELIRLGPYRTMRHPIYAGMLLGLLGTALVVGEVRSLLALVILGLGFYLKAHKEEAFLSREFGAGFEAHAKHTGMFLPRV